MPVRWTIHSADVSTVVSSSAFETARAGSAEPAPRTQARIEAGPPPRDASDSGPRERRTLGGGEARLMGGSFPWLRLGGGRTRGHRTETVRVGDHLSNLAEQFLTHHVIRQFHGAGVAFGVRAAMSLDDNAVKPQKDAAGRRAHLGAQRGDRLVGEEEPDA